MKEDYFVDQEHVEVTQRLECFPQNSPPSVFESSERKDSYCSSLCLK